MRIKRNQADALFSDYVRTRDMWTCQRCLKRYPEKSQGLHCAHIYSRRHWNTRHSPDNALALCHGCHQYFGGNPIEFTRWCEDRLGSKAMDNLYLRAHATAKKSRYDERLRVMALKEMRARQECVA